MSVCVCVCVCVRERGREGGREREVCVRVRGREGGRGKWCVCVCAGFSTAGQVDSAQGNLASSFVNGFVNCGFGVDKLLTEDGNKWIYKNKVGRGSLGERGGSNIRGPPPLPPSHRGLVC